MKKTIMVTAGLVLGVWMHGQAQTKTGGALEGNTGQQGSSPQNNARKANSSQNLGKGVPYNKEAEQQGKAGATKSNIPVKGSSPNASSQTGSRQGGQSTNKKGSSSSSKSNNQ